MRKLLFILLLLTCAATAASVSGQNTRGRAARDRPKLPTPIPAASSAAITLIKEGRHVEAEKILQDVLLSAAPDSAQEKESKKLLLLNAERRIAVQAADARALVDAKKYDEAEAKLREATSGATADIPEAKEASALLDELLTVRRQKAQIEQAKSLIGGGDFAAASTVITDVLDKAKAGEVIKEATEVDAEIHRSAHSPWHKLFSHYYTTLWLILDIVLGLLGLLLLLFLVRWIYSKTQSNEWTLFPIEDKTGLGISDAVVESMGRWTAPNMPISAGLLKLEMLQFASVPRLDGQDQSFEMDLAPAVAALPLKVGAVDLSGLAQIFSPFRRWLNAKRPWIKGGIFATKTLITVRLTKCGTDGKTTSVTSSAEKARGVEAAESASYKMYYLIANTATIEEAGAADQLRLGLNLLKQYVNNRTPEKLNEAYKAFRNARNESPSFEEAYLYEGIVLDLMEQHDEAIKRFQFLAQPENTPSNEELREKAKCNEAIARFRKYKPDEIRKSIEILDHIVGADVTDDDLVDSPLKAMALATKANAIAHKPIFWQEFLFPGNLPSSDTTEIKDRKARKATVLRNWINEVKAITDRLKVVEGRIKADKSPWDDLTTRQLMWAVHNATGNVYLNYAKNVLGQPVPPQVDNQELRKQDLEKAYAAFQNCEMLLPPGVETLTNLATVLTELGREAEARKYLKAAVDLNREYEYAYYRMAQSWEKQNNAEEVVKVLKEFARIKAASIPNFKAIYSKYATELAQS